MDGRSAEFYAHLLAGMLMIHADQLLTAHGPHDDELNVFRFEEAGTGARYVVTVQQIDEAGTAGQGLARQDSV